MIDITFWPLPDSPLRNPDVSTRASGRAPRAIHRAARTLPRLAARRRGVPGTNQLVELERADFTMVSRIDDAVAARDQDHARPRRAWLDQHGAGAADVDRFIGKRRTGNAEKDCRGAQKADPM